MKRIAVLGGDGFCGWPTSLHLSEKGHEVIILDNLSRRKIDIELGCDSLTPLKSIDDRCKVWNKLTGNTLRFKFLHIAQNYAELLQFLRDEKPDTIIHFAEQRAAPYSMKDSRRKRYTVDNNIIGTHNLLSAIVESEQDIHVIHLGTMGVYGYGTSGGEIPEGYIDVILPGGRSSKILHPSYPGSIYHMTKCLDALIFQFYNKNDGIRITDLHQGIVWGTNTPQTIRDERLINRFDYDSDYGTVLNRFLMQAALDIPLTVYGTGGQTRAFIHITDTARCVEIAVNNPPRAGDKVEIFNQIAETLRVRELAHLVSSKTGCSIRNLVNPRKEDAENELKVTESSSLFCFLSVICRIQVSNKKFCNLGLDPVTLDQGLLDEVVTIASKYKERCDRNKILPSSYWSKEIKEASHKDKSR
jgi:UDP-sulfoquinovose synthase